MIPRWLAWILAPLALAACTAQPFGPEPGVVLGPALERFAADGRISLRQGERSDHLHFDWRHTPERDLVLFSSPLGQGLAELGRDPGGAWLKRPGQAQMRAGDLSALTLQIFGMALPLDMLVEWIGGAHAELRGEVDGWRIEVTESATYAGHRLPRRIEVRRDDIELRIVITGWGERD